MQPNHLTTQELCNVPSDNELVLELQRRLEDTDITLTQIASVVDNAPEPEESYNKVVADLGDLDMYDTLEHLRSLAFYVAGNCDYNKRLLVLVQSAITMYDKESTANQNHNDKLTSLLSDYL